VPGDAHKPPGGRDPATKERRLREQSCAEMCTPTGGNRLYCSNWCREPVPVFAKPSGRLRAGLARARDRPPHFARSPGIRPLRRDSCVRVKTGRNRQYKKRGTYRASPEKGGRGREEAGGDRPLGLPGPRGTPTTSMWPDSCSSVGYRGLREGPKAEGVEDAICPPQGNEPDSASRTQARTA
jgi:hypothetical protein